MARCGEKLLRHPLEQQYGTNVEIQDGKRVEFAVYLPGSEERPLLLPIDSKFPMKTTTGFECRNKGRD